MIELRECSFFYEEKEIFSKLSFSMEANEKRVLLGSNGSGKSTLLRILAGLYFPKEGEYLFQKQQVTKQSMRALRKNIGILFQNPDSMIFNATVYDEIAFSLGVFGFSDIKDRVEAIAKSFEIEHLLKKNPLQLSGGEKQKMMLAAVLVYEPKLLLLDEPTSAMDPKTTGWLIDFLLELKTTTLIATHDISFAYESCEAVDVMDEHHTFIFNGAIEELMQNKDVLESANLIHKHKHRHKHFHHSHYHLH